MSENEKSTINGKLSDGSPCPLSYWRKVKVGFYYHYRLRKFFLLPITLWESKEELIQGVFMLCVVLFLPALLIGAIIRKLLDPFIWPFTKEAKRMRLDSWQKAESITNAKGKF